MSNGRAREVIGSKKFKCDTKSGKKCIPVEEPRFRWVKFSRCKHCGKPMSKGR